MNLTLSCSQTLAVGTRGEGVKGQKIMGVHCGFALYWLCVLGQVASHLWALIFSSMGWEQDEHSDCCHSVVLRLHVRARPRAAPQLDSDAGVGVVGRGAGEPRRARERLFHGASHFLLETGAEK